MARKQPVKSVSKFVLRFQYPCRTRDRYLPLHRFSVPAGLFSLILPVLSHAELPVEPTVVHGNAAFDTVGSQMTVTNSPNAIINWQDFSIGANHGVHFQQLDAASQVLNRVVGDDPSHILGNLSSNGGVWLINPHGVLFGQNARIDVGGLVASTLDISNIDFMAGKYNFVAGGTGASAVANQGAIHTTLGGRVWLVGGQVRNEGLIQTPGGNAVLAAGKSVELIDSGAPNVVVRVVAPENEAVNLGSLVASGGSVDVHGSIVNQGGIIRADSVGADSSGRITLKASQALSLADNSVTGASGGNVTMDAGASTYLAGLVDASRQQGVGGSVNLTTGRLEGMAGGSLRADGEQGGSIRVEGLRVVGFSSLLSATGTLHGGTIDVTGDRVYLLNADIDASGGIRGGMVHLGGGWQGAGSLPHAREVLVGEGSEVKANGSLDSANAGGGEVVVWSTENSSHYGMLQARNGGRIELSSRGEIRQAGEIQAGPSGTVLFDPKNLVITDTPPNSVTLAQTIANDNLFGAEPSLSAGDFFGTSIALEGNNLAIGATPDNGPGRVYLFNVDTNFSTLTWQKNLTAVSGAFGQPDVGPTNDSFGASVALDGDRLAVAATPDGADSVYLFDGVGSDFTGLTLRATVSSQGSHGMPSLGPTDNNFGASLALDGDLLAVGADLGDTSPGAVHLFTGMNTQGLAGLGWAGRLGGDTVPVANMPSLEVGGGFGKAVSLEGDRMAVGAWRDGSSGAVHLFSGIDAGLSGITWQRRVAPGVDGVPVLPNEAGFGRAVGLDGDRLVVGVFNSQQAPIHLFTGLSSPSFANLAWQRQITSPNQNDGSFGHSVALDGERLAVGGPFDSGSHVEGATYLFTGVSNLGSSVITVGDANFSTNPSDTSYITPGSITTLLNAGTAVTLQANNDIGVQSPITTTSNSEFGPGGNLTLQAGRSVTFAANVATASGNLVAIAGDGGANASFRDPGTPTLTIANGVNMNVGGGTATLAAIGGNFINNNGDAAISTGEGGRWLIYAADPSTSTEGFSSYTKHYNQAFGPVPAYASEGNWFLYSVVPTLLVAPNSQTITYGNPELTFNPGFSGFIDGDTDALSGESSPVWSVGGATSTSGNPTAGAHDVAYAGGLVSGLGYQLADNQTSSNELTVDALEVAATGVTVENKVYDGTAAATLSSGSLSDVVGGEGGVDQVTLSGAFDNKNVGTGKPVTLALSGADSGNYTLVSFPPSLTADVTPKLLTTSSFTAQDKVYDGNTNAIISGDILTEFVAGDTVSLSGVTGTFNNKNVGVDKPVSISGVSLTGADAGNYVLNTSGIPPLFADITPRPVTANGFIAQDKVYDATTSATVSGGSLVGLVEGDTVSFSDASGRFNDANVGVNKPVSISGIALAGADATNYTLNTGNIAPASADITPATLTLIADPAVRLAGLPISGLSGRAVGFRGEDNLENATAGTLMWTTPATATSPAGVYAINGTGLIATNYILEPALGNTTALTVVSGIDPVNNPKDKQNTLDTSVQSINTAIYGSFPVLDFVTTGFVNDLAALRVPKFGRLDLSRMSRDDMRRLIEERREFKEKLFADAIYKLEQDPSLASVPLCPSLADINTGLCRVTDAQRMALASKVAEEDLHKRHRRTKVAKLPQIERKFVVLFGIDAYADKSIPQLENAITDAETLGRMFADKLGYEATVVKNATKAEIVRTLNRLSTVMHARDSVILYYAGHGYRNEKTGGGYWIPSDASPSDPTSWISNTDVSRMMSDISAKQMVMIADSCYSGTFTEQKLGVSGIGTAIKPDEVLAKRSVIVMSSGGDEPVADEGKEGHSIFAWDLMQALRNVDNWQPGTAIFEEVKREVMKSFPQTPQYGAMKSAGHEAGGEYLFEFRQLEDVQ